MNTKFKEKTNNIPKEKPQTDSKSLRNRLCAPKAPTASRKALPFKRFDWIAMICITLFYALFAFHDLGRTTAPVTEMAIPYNMPILLSGSEGKQIYTICWYLLNEEDITFSLEAKNHSDTEWVFSREFTMEDVFSWEGLVLPQPYDEIRIINITKHANVGELILMDNEGNILELGDDAKASPLFDEQHTFTKTIDHLNSCYFDEVYYTQTAYEFMNGLPTTEISHPPFGKIIIAIGATIFGTTPFGFRFMGTLFGVLMLPFMYLIGRNLTQNRIVGAFICFIFAFDFMHFTQTRITTIDVFITFFIILMFYFMERYVNLSFYDTSLKKTWIPLGACGIAFGFGIATKWPGFYAGAGLAVLFFAQLFIRYKEYRYALLSPSEATNNISHQHIIDCFKKNTLQTILFCLVFYIVIPFTIYLCSYIPFVEPQTSGLLETMLSNQSFMFTYHSQLDATHAYSSKWYEWPTMVRPILYYDNNLGGEVRQGISAFGNPLVWWTGIPAFLYMLYLAIVKKKKEAAFLCVSYLAQYLPWSLVPRYTFIYHYFPSVPFLTLMIGYSFLQFKEPLVEKQKINIKTYYCILIIYAVATFALFQLFLPVLSGETITRFYANDYLKWFKSWVLIR